jgi:hypothetical protein
MEPLRASARVGARRELFFTDFPGSPLPEQGRLGVGSRSSREAGSEPAGVTRPSALEL